MAATAPSEKLIELENGEVFIAAWESNLHRFEQINGKSLQGLLEVDAITNQIFTEDPAFAPFRTVLGDAPEQQALVLRAVTTHNFPPESDYPVEVYNKVLLASHVKEQMGRAYISRLLENGVTFGLAPWEQEVLQTSCQVGGLYDRMCAKWREDVSRNPANAKARELGLTNQYAIIAGNDNDGYEQVAYWDAYREELQRITDLWTELAEKLVKDSPSMEQIDMAAFLHVYVDALKSTDLDRLPDQWKDVDRVWLKVTGRLQPIPSREYDYFDPNKIRVFPDFRLAVLLEDPELEKACQETQAAQIKYLTELFEASSVFQETLIGMTKVQLFQKTYDIIFAGSLDFQAAGQSLPNEQVVRDEAGAKVFLNFKSMEEKWKVALEAAGKTFTDDLWLFEKVNVGHDGLAIMTAGHEYGEPLFNSNAVTESLGGAIVAMLNEDLATETVTAIMPLWHKDDGVTRDDMTFHAIYLLGNYLRYIALARGTEHLRPYYEGMGLLGLRRMIESGFIHQDIDGGWHVEMRQLDSFYEAALKDLQTQVEIAQNGNQMLATRYLVPAGDMEKLPAIADLISKIIGK